MPLRSVEAATRDDAIAAAREQFGPTARVVGVRRVRSGGVLGFFATERYVAEVADPAGRPVAPEAPVASWTLETAFDETSSGYSSPLASAAPARARAAAPARNGAAAWAAESARSSKELPAAPPQSSPAMARVPAGAPVQAPPAARTGSHPAAARADEERLSELTGLLAPPPVEAPVHARASFPRAEFQRSASPRQRPRDDGPQVLQEESGLGDGGPADPAAPSPFTAALARMVASDRDVRQAVREALDDPAVPRARSDKATWPIRHEAFGPEYTSVASPATRQKEETVGDQVIAPSTFAGQPVEVPAWAAEPQVLAPSGSSREQAIAEVLRAALALGHSDEALAGILRKVLAGVAPQTALTQPELPVAASPVPEVVVRPAAVPVELAAPVLESSSAMPSEFATPVAVGVGSTADDIAAVASEVSTRARVQASEPACAPVAAPALFPAASPLHPASPTVRTEPAPLFPAPAPTFAAPAPFAPPPFAPPPLFAPSLGSMWGDPSPAPLWGEPVTVAVSRVRQPEAPMWTEPALADRAHPDTEAAAPAEVTAEVPAESGVVEPEPPAPAVDVDLDGSGNQGTTTVPDATVDTTAESTGEPIVCEEPPASHSAELGAPDVAQVAPAESDTRLEGELDGQPDAPVESEELEPDELQWDEVEPVTEVLAETTVEDTADGSLPGRSPEAVVLQTTADAEVAADTETPAGARSESAAEAEAEVTVEAAVEAGADDDTTVAEVAPMLARTASDFAPFMSLDATTVMPPLSLLPPLPSSRGRGRGRPPVPPASRPLSRRAVSSGGSPSAPAPTEPAEDGTDTEAPVAAPATTAPATRSWATVTHLPVAPLMATQETPELDTDEVDEGADAVLPGSAHQLPGSEQEVVLPPVAEVGPRTPGRPDAGDVRSRLAALGLPAGLLGDSFEDDLAGRGTYAALTSALAQRLPVAPQLPAGAGEVLFVVGPGVETLRAARSLAATLRLDRDAVQWATRGELAGLAPKGSRMTTVETAMDRQQDAVTSGSVTIVAVDAPLRSDTHWMSQMLAIWAPTAVWVVVEATRKPEDLQPWIDGLPRVDALVVTDADLSTDPAAVLRRSAAPVAILDGVRATPHRWASLLCERLEKAEA